jgi:ADP-ribose pyrophosphatase YjhB (NUDIX family)
LVPPTSHRNAASNDRVTRIHLATALVVRDAHVLLVASTYPNHPQPLWNMPGGRQLAAELLSQTAVRELREETGLDGELRGLAYVSESYDDAMHFTNFTFYVDVQGEPQLQHAGGDHVVDVQWVPFAKVAERVVVRVVREPLLAVLNGSTQRYFGYAEAEISIVFPD